MATNILILGNGFDLAMGRKTSYSDFLGFVEQLFSGKYPDDFQVFLESLNTDDKSVGDRISKLLSLKSNLFIDYIRENKESLGNNWADIEHIISSIAEAILEIKNNINDYANVLSYGLTYQQADSFANKSNTTAFIFVCETLSEKSYKQRTVEEPVLPTSEMLQQELLEQEFSKEGLIGEYPKASNLDIVEELNQDFIDSLDELTDLLELYLSYLDYLDFERDKIELKETALSAIDNISSFNVINFNYTNSALKLLKIPLMNTHFVHGRIDITRKFSPINTMVFGIEDKEVNMVNTDLIPYQKYYQRIVKETGSAYELFLKKGATFTQTEAEIEGPINIVVFGHSVDPLDKEIFQKCFCLTKRIGGSFQYKFIFTYYDEWAKRSIVKNLAVILGKDEVIELTGSNRIAFVRSDDKERMYGELLVGAEEYIDL